MAGSARFGKSQETTDESRFNAPSGDPPSSIRAWWCGADYHHNRPRHDEDDGRAKWSEIVSAVEDSEDEEEEMQDDEEGFSHRQWVPNNVTRNQTRSLTTEELNERAQGEETSSRYILPWKNTLLFALGFVLAVKMIAALASSR